MLKELSVKEALTLLAEKYPEPVYGYAWSEHSETKQCIKLAAVNTIDEYPFDARAMFKHFAIEVADKYRYMTQQECIDWVCLHGYKGYQVKQKHYDTWYCPPVMKYYETPCDYEYRTIQEIDGKVAYGEPQEFKVKV